MEEKKAKEVKMENNSKEQKLSYEQLNQVCAELYQQNQKLIQQLREANMTNMFKRLDYLFMAINAATTIKDPEFINNCIDEIKEALTINGREEEEVSNEK